MPTCEVRSPPDIILAGGTGCLDPVLYDPRVVAGFGFSIFDVIGEGPQPAGWCYGRAPLWSRIWLGVDDPRMQ